MKWNVPVSPPEGSMLNWYEMKADPEDGRNLIVCGAIWNARDNAYYGVVYTSHDAGQSWKTALEDRDSAWVSEQSCAFGERHRAYFISAASKIIDGEPHHDLGTTRVFLSPDAGETWSETATTGWADYSNSTVGKPPDSKVEKLYVVYQVLPKHEGRDLRAGLGFFTVSSDGKSVSEPQTIPGMSERNYTGIYPTSFVTLKDGTPIALFEASLGKGLVNGLLRFEIGAVRFGPSGPLKPSLIATHTARYDGFACPATLSNSLAYDRSRDRLYAAYNDATSGHCAIMLTRSDDGGRTWSPAHELSAPGATRFSGYFPLLGVNPDGVVGLLWRGRPEKSPDCWYFSISRDGLGLDETLPLSNCANDSFKNQSSGYLATVVKQPQAGQPASIQMMTFRNRLLRIGFAVTPDGVFHPLWSVSGSGAGELRTASISVGQRSQSAPTQPTLDAKLADVTDKIIVLYGGEQRLDHETNSVMVDLAFRNNSHVSLSGPIYVQVENMSSDFGRMELRRSSPVLPLGRDYIDLSSSLPSGSLAPGETTTPYPVTFRLLDANHASDEKSTILRLKVRLFCDDRN